LVQFSYWRRKKTTRCVKRKKSSIWIVPNENVKLTYLYCSWLYARIDCLHVCWKGMLPLNIRFAIRRQILSWTNKNFIFSFQI
jgi:hypothetical protein